MSNSLVKKWKLFTTTVKSGGGVGAAVWGTITGTLSDQTDLQAALDSKLDDTATTADVDPSTDRNYVTDIQLDVIEEIVALHDGTVNIDFGISGDYLTTTVAAPWVTSTHYGKIKCEVLDDGSDHLNGEAALNCILATVNNIIVGVSFDITIVSQHDTWGNYVVKYNEII